MKTTKPLSEEEWFNLRLTLGRHKKIRHLEPVEAAIYLKRAHDSGLSMKELEERARISIDMISKFLKLLEIKNPNIRDAIAWNGKPVNGEISPSIGWHLPEIKEQKDQKELFDAILKTHLTKTELKKFLYLKRKNKDMTIKECVKRTIDGRTVKVETFLVIGSITSEKLSKKLGNISPLERNRTLRDVLKSELPQVTFNGARLKKKSFIIFGESDTKKQLSTIEGGFEETISKLLLKKIVS